MGRDGDPRTRTITEVLGIAIHLQSFLKALPLYSIYEDYVTLVGGGLRSISWLPIFRRYHSSSCALCHVVVIMAVVLPPYPVLIFK